MEGSPLSFLYPVRGYHRAREMTIKKTETSKQINSTAETGEKFYQQLVNTKKKIKGTGCVDCLMPLNTAIRSQREENLPWS